VNCVNEFNVAYSVNCMRSESNNGFEIKSRLKSRYARRFECSESCDIGEILRDVSKGPIIFVFSVRNFVTAKMKTPRSSGTSSATRPATQCHILQDGSLQPHSSESLKSCVEAGVLDIRNVSVKPMVKNGAKTWTWGDRDQS
jgi:hypothetical protein